MSRRVWERYRPPDREAQARSEQTRGACVASWSFRVSNSPSQAVVRLGLAAVGGQALSAWFYGVGSARLLRAQGNRRIDARGAPSRNTARRGRHPSQEHGHAGVGYGIERRNAEK